MVCCSACRVDSSIAFYKEKDGKTFLCNSCHWLAFDKQTALLYEVARKRTGDAELPVQIENEILKPVAFTEMTASTVPQTALLKPAGGRQPQRQATGSIVQAGTLNVAASKLSIAGSQVATIPVSTTVTRRNAVAKGKGRRAIFKPTGSNAANARNKPQRIAHADATYTTVEWCLSRGHIWHKGDIVSLRDADSGEIFYAQINGLVKQPDLTHGVALTWLLPIRGYDLEELRRHFNAEAFVLGPVEEYPRPLDQAEFVCHAPKDLYSPHLSPFAQQGSLHDCIVTTIRPVKSSLSGNSIDAVFGVNNSDYNSAKASSAMEIAA